MKKGLALLIALVLIAAVVIISTPSVNDSSYGVQYYSSYDNQNIG